MIYRVFESQKRNRSKKDWVTTVLTDLEELNWNINLEDIKKMKKNNFLNIVKRKIQHKTLVDLNKIKQSHSKVQHLEHEVLKMKQYFMPNNLKMNKEDCQMIFKLRCRVTETKMNMKGMYDEQKCRACGKISETQEHVIQCEAKNMIILKYQNMKRFKMEMSVNNC